MHILNIPLSSWLVFIGLNSLVLVSSYCLASRLTKASGFSVTLASTLFIYLSQITVSVLLFGVVFRWLEAWPLGVFNALLAIAVLKYYWDHRKPFLSSLALGLSELFSEGKGWVYLLFALLVLQILISLFKVAIMPVHIADSLAYRAPPAAMWYQLGHIPSMLDVPVNEINGRALGISVLMLWYFIFLTDSLWVNLPQFISAMTLLFIVYAIARQCGVSRPWAFKAAVLCFFMPSVLIQSTATQDHLSVNVAFLGTLFFIREFFIRKDRRLILLIGITLGLMFGFKNNAVVYMPVLLGAYLFLGWQHRHETLVTVGRRKQFIQYGLLAVVLAASIGGYWTARNLIVFGDPFGMTFVPFNQINTVYDLVSQDKGGMEDSGIELPNVFESFLRSKNLTGNLKDFFPRILDEYGYNYQGHLRNVSGFGPQFFTFGLLALLWLVVAVFRRSWRLPGMFYAVSGAGLLIIYFCVMKNIYAYRNFIFFAVLLLVFFASMATSLKANKGTRLLLNSLVVLSVLWCMFVLLPPTYAKTNLLKEFVSLERSKQTTGRYITYFRVFPKILRELNVFPGNEAIAYINPGARNTWIYAQYDVNWQRRVVYIPMLDSYMTCNKISCTPSEALKKELIKRQVFLVNMCVSDSCPIIKDPEFFEIGRGLHYFKPAGVSHE